MDRRPVAARNSVWAVKLSGFLVQAGFTPNVISLFSVCFAMLAGMALYFSNGNIPTFYLFIAACAIQLRLLCNLMDGMVAVEHMKTSKTGELYNEIPDRISDCIILVSVGIAVQNQPGALHLAYIAALLALLTAYLRALSGHLVRKQTFVGPMAKQRRMDVLSLCAVIDAFQYLVLSGSSIIPMLYYALWIIVIGALITSIKRLQFIANSLNSESASMENTI